MTTVIVFGARNMQDCDLVHKALDSVHSVRGGISTVVQGGQQGCDRWAQSWAFNHNVPIKTYEEDWKRHGRGAKSIRDLLMLESHRFAKVVAFPGGDETRKAVEAAIRLGMEVSLVRRLGPSLMWTHNPTMRHIAERLHNRHNAVDGV